MNIDQLAPAGTDAITLEIVKNALSSIADEMALVVLRIAYSPIVRDSMDFSTAVFDRDGRATAQGLTLPILIGAFSGCHAKRRPLYRIGRQARECLHHE